MSLAKLTKEMSDLTWDDARFYSSTYWAETEPKIKSIESKISDISEILIEACRQKETKSYSDMSVKERWKNSSIETQKHTYQIHLGKYFNGDNSMLRLLKNDISSIIIAESKANNEDKNLISYKIRAGSSFASATVLGIGLPIMLAPSKDGSYSLPEEYLPYFIAASAIFIGGMLCYAMYNTIKHSLKKGEIEKREFLTGLVSEIIEDLPEEYLSKALDIAKDKLSFFSEIKKA